MMFDGNYGWYQRFETLSDPKNISVTGEVASAHVDVVKLFPQFLKEKIAAGNYAAK